MNFINHYYLTLIKYDLVNKFYYSKFDNIPKLEKIVVTCIPNKTINFKRLATQLLAFELLFLQKGTIKKKFNISLRIKKGNMVGCKITLRRVLMNIFFFKVIVLFLPTIKQFSPYTIEKKTKFFTFQLKNILNFTNLGNYYQIFSQISNLNILIVSNSQFYDDFYFILKSYKFPIQIKYNDCLYKRDKWSSGLRR